MPSTTSNPPDREHLSTRLAEFRAEIDGLDDAIHDLLMARAAVVMRLRAGAGKGPIALRPGREADILRRLLARHHGDLPGRAVVRVWREVLAGTTIMQGPFVVSACETGADSGYVQCAREHFGASTPLKVHRSPSQAIADVRAGAATAAVLPLPTEEEPSPWWTSLLHQVQPRIHVVGRLPFWAPRVEGAPGVQALVVGALPPDRSSLDRSLFALELPAGQSRAHLSATLAAAGFADARVLLRRDPPLPEARALIDVDGFVTEDDPRLVALSDALRPPVVLGAYAQPVEGDTA
jgi:chorismate mutase